jgi:hypothetical protein
LLGGSRGLALVGCVMNTNQKLVEISRIMADGFHFVKMRELMEHLSRESDQKSAQQILEMVDNFHRLCVYVEKKGTENA